MQESELEFISIDLGLPEKDSSESVEETEITNKYTRNKIIWIVAIACAGISLSIGIPILVLSQNNNSLYSSLRVINGHVATLIAKDMLYIENIVRRSNEIMNHNGIYTANDEYEILTQVVSSPVVNAIETVRFLPIVKKAELPAYAKFCREHIHPECKPHGYSSSNGQLDLNAPLKDKSTYLFHTQNTPSGIISTRIIGLDLQSEPNALDQFFAISEKTVITSGLPLVSLPKGENGIYMIRKANGGYSLAAIKVSALFDSALTIDLVRDIAKATVFDVTDKPHLLFSEKNVTNIDEIDIENPLTTVLQMPVFNRNWTVYIEYDSSIVESSKNSDFYVVVIILPVLTASSCIIFILLYNEYQRRSVEKELAVRDKSIANRMVEYVNHEVRNPLQGIMGLTDLTKIRLEDMANVIETEPLVSDLDTVLRLCNLLQHIVNDILDIRKLTEQKVKLDEQWVAVSGVVDEIKKIMKYKFDEKYPHCSFIIDNRLDGYSIFIDRFRLLQILINFLTNAIKYTDEGYIALRIMFDHNKVMFKVEDTGRGIPDDRKSLIFKPFEQAKKEDSSRYGGIGLGLHLCKLLASLMNVEINFKSVYNQGSTFWIECNGEMLVKKTECATDRV